MHVDVRDVHHPPFHNMILTRGSRGLHVATAQKAKTVNKVYSS